MVNPIDYMSYMPKPNLAQNFMQGLQVGEGIQSIRDKRAAQEQMQAKHEAFQTDLRETLNNPTQGRFRNLMALYPEMGKHLAPVSESFSEERKKNEQKLAIETTTMIEGGREDLAMENLRTAIEARKNSGIDPKEYKLHQQALSALESGNTKLAQGLLNTGAAILDPEGFKNMTEGQVSAATKGDQIEAERLGNLQTRADINLSQARARTAGQPDTVVNVNNEQQGEFAKKMGGNYAQIFTESKTEAKSAQGMLASLKTMQKALSNPDVYQGSGGETVAKLKKVGESLGFDVGGVADSDVAKTVTNQLALRMRNPDSGFGLTGGTSERDVQFLLDSVAGLGKSREGNEKIIDLAIRAEKQKIKRYRAQSDYYRKNGTIDSGYEDVEQKLNDEYVKDLYDILGVSPEEREDQGATSNASGSSNVNIPDNSIYSDEEIMSLING